jgi:hypothetical protein
MPVLFEGKFTKSSDMCDVAVFICLKSFTSKWVA